MKTMQDFAVQQLSKKEMNEVKGGAGACGFGIMEWNCTFKIKGGGSVSGRVCAADAMAAVIVGGQQIEKSLGWGFVVDQTCIS